MNSRPHPRRDESTHGTLERSRAGQEIARRFGDETLAAMAAIGVRFGD